MNTEIYVFLKKNELSLNNHLPSPNHLTEEYSNFCSSFMRYSLNLWKKKLTFLPTQIKFINNKSCDILYIWKMAWGMFPKKYNKMLHTSQFPSKVTFILSRKLKTCTVVSIWVDINFRGICKNNFQENYCM